MCKVQYYSSKGFIVVDSETSWFTMSFCCLTVLTRRDPQRREHYCEEKGETISLKIFQFLSSHLSCSTTFDTVCTVPMISKLLSGLLLVNVGHLRWQFQRNFPRFGHCFLPRAIEKHRYRMISIQRHEGNPTTTYGGNTCQGHIRNISRVHLGHRWAVIIPQLIRFLPTAF